MTQGQGHSTYLSSSQVQILAIVCKLPAKQEKAYNLKGETLPSNTAIIHTESRNTYLQTVRP